MSGKRKHPCVVCGRGIATHRSSGRICSTGCRTELKALASRERRFGGNRLRGKSDSSGLSPRLRGQTPPRNQQ